MADGAELIALERRRQVEQEGWTPDHDDRHGLGEIALAAAAYALAASGRSAQGAVWWPWGEWDYKPDKGTLSNLVRAGALIAAEIDRLQRQGDGT